MDTRPLSETVATYVADAIRTSGRSESSVSRDTGIPLATLRRKLSNQGRVSFTVGELALIAAILEMDPTDFFPKRAAS